MDPPANTTEVHFGSTVTMLREDGRRQTYRIVGEDEADPSAGTLSYVSPVAQALMGKQVGEMVEAGAAKRRSWRSARDFGDDDHDQFKLQQTSSWPGLSRPSTILRLAVRKFVDARHKAGHDDTAIVG